MRRNLFDFVVSVDALEESVCLRRDNRLDFVLRSNTIIHSLCAGYNYD